MSTNTQNDADNDGFDEIPLDTLEVWCCFEELHSLGPDIWNYEADFGHEPFKGNNVLTNDSLGPSLKSASKEAADDDPNHQQPMDDSPHLTLSQEGSGGEEVTESPPAIHSGDSVKSVRTTVREALAKMDEDWGKLSESSDDSRDTVPTPEVWETDPTT